MEMFYLNNFRGFHNTFLNLENVNFFVGENSTGKTSILSILKIFSEPTFLFEAKFNTDDIELGYFKDIVSRATKGEKYFEVGVLPNQYDVQLKNGMGAYFMRFYDHEGRPKLREFIFATHNKTIKVIFKGKSIQYDVDDFSLPVTKTTEDKIKVFKTWIEKANTPLQKFHKLKNKFPGIPPLYLVRMEIETELNKDNEKSEKYLGGFGWPVILGPYFTWIAPIRAKPQRLYEQFREKHTPEGEHMPIMIKTILKNKNENLIKSLNNFGLESGLFDEIKIKELGRDKTSPFEIQIRLKNMSFRISNVGYGVSQILPLITEILMADKNQWIAIQQPEVHLHPKAQAAFGEFLFEALSENQTNFIIETHSDYTIDRFRLKYKRDKKKIGKAQVIYFERKENKNIIHHIPILDDGSYYNLQPDSFRKFFITEELNLLEI